MEHLEDHEEPLYEAKWRTYESDQEIIEKVAEGSSTDGLVELDSESPTRLYKKGEYLLKFTETYSDFGPEVVTISYFGDLGEDWNEAKEVLTELKEETKVRDDFSKQESVHLHGLMAELRNNVEMRDVNVRAQSYEEMNIAPLSIHKSKYDHHEAILRLTKEIAESLEREGRSV